MVPKGSRLTIPTPPPAFQKNMLIKKIIWDSISATFQGIFAIQCVDRSTKPVVVVLVMSLHINWKVRYVDSMSRKY